MNIGKQCATLHTHKNWVEIMAITMNKTDSNYASAIAEERDLGQVGAQVKAYEKPVLIVYGDVRDVTLGPTPGLGESGCEFQRQAGSPLQCP